MRIRTCLYYFNLDLIIYQDLDTSSHCNISVTITPGYTILNPFLTYINILDIFIAK